MNASPIEFTPKEQRVIEDLRRAGGFQSDSDVLACSIFLMTLQLNVTCPAGVFDVPWNPKLRQITKAMRA